MLANPMYADEMDYQPYREYNSATDERQWKTSCWLIGHGIKWHVSFNCSTIHILIHCWIQDEISKDPDTVGATFVPVILGSDKTTVSVGTGNNEYYPLYLSIANV